MPITTKSTEQSRLAKFKGLFGIKPPPVPVPAEPLSELEAKAEAIKKARRGKLYTVPNPKQEARIMARLVLTADWNNLIAQGRAVQRAYEPLLAVKSTHKHARLRAAKKQYTAQVAAAVQQGQKLPPEFSLEAVMAENNAVVGGANAALAKLRAEAFPLMLEIGTRILAACHALAAEAETQERELAETWGAEFQGGPIGNAYAGLAAYYASYMPDDPRSVRSPAAAFPLLAALLKAK